MTGKDVISAFPIVIPAEAGISRKDKKENKPN